MDFISTPLGYVLRWCYQFTQGLGFGGYALALLFFSLIMQIILFPFGIKQQKNSQKQAKLRPKEAAIAKKYAGRTDKATQQKINEEKMKLYQDERYSPLSGCLPMLIQLPILFALFDVVRRPLTYISRLSKDAVYYIYQHVITLPGAEDLVTSAVKSAENAKNIPEMQLLNFIPDNMETLLKSEGLIDGASQFLKPNFSFFGNFMNLADSPQAVFSSGALVLVLIPILTFVAQYFGQKLTRKYQYIPSTAESASSMKLMNTVFPLFSVYLAFIWPAAMGLYWIYRSILAFLQQYALSKIYPIPPISEEEMKAAEKQYNTQAKAKPYKITEETKRRSLLYDDDDLPDAGLPGKKGSLLDDSPKGDRRDTTVIERAPLKRDDDK